MCETELHNLVIQAREGDVIAFGELVRKTQQMVYGLCLRMLRKRRICGHLRGLRNCAILTRFADGSAGLR